VLIWQDRREEAERLRRFGLNPATPSPTRDATPCPKPQLPAQPGPPLLPSAFTAASHTYPEVAW
jgi:hypothetical protein